MVGVNFGHTKIVENEKEFKEEVDRIKKLHSSPDKKELLEAMKNMNTPIKKEVE